LSFTASPRRRLAEAGKLLTPDERQKCCLIVKPATILAWFRQVAAKTYDSSEVRRGRPPKPKDGIAGTVRYTVFFVIVVKTRTVEIRGIGVDPDGEWMKQMARNLTDGVDGFLQQARFLIHDRDPLFTEAFKRILGERGVECVKIPAQSPNCNSYAERFVKTIRNEALNHFVFFGERHLRNVIKEFVAHYHRERFHQGLGGQLIERPTISVEQNGAKGRVVCRSRLGGMLNFYHR